MGKEKKSSNVEKVDAFWVYLKAYDHKVLDLSSKKMIDAMIESGAEVSGPIPMPTIKKKYTIVKAPHEYSSKEHFERRTHRRMIVVKNANAHVVSSLSSFSLPAGVGIQVKQR